MPTLADLNARAVELKRDMATIELPRFTEASEIAKRLNAHADVQRLKALADELPESQVRSAMLNVAAAADALAAIADANLPGLAALAGQGEAPTE